MLYRRSVNKLMHRAILLSRRHGNCHSGFRFNKSPRYICIKIPNSYSSASPLDLRYSGSRNKPTIVSSRSAAVDDMLRREEGCGLGGRGGRGWSRKSDRMSATNLSAILREFFPRQRATSGENRALRLHSLINMQIWRHDARRGKEGGRKGKKESGTKAERRERKGVREGNRGSRGLSG